jgi:transposase
MHTFTHNSMASLLHLQGVIIYKVNENEKGFNIKIGQPRAPVNCIHCGSGRFIKNGKGRVRKIRHGISISGKPVFLFYTSKRFFCKDCKRSWSSRLPKHLVEGRKRSTTYCRDQALRTLQTNSFGNTRKQTGLSYNTLREILHEFMKFKPLINIPADGPLIIGVDEHGRAKRKLATTITLIKPERRLLGLIAKATSNELVKWVKDNMSYAQRLRVTEISMDMTKSLKKQLRLLFPNAKFVMDHFHVIAYLNNLIRDEYTFTVKYGYLTKENKSQLPARSGGFGIVRTLYQSGKYWQEKDKEKVKAVFTVMPRVAELWHAKEEARAIYRESLDKNEARNRWQYVLSLMPEVAKRTLKLNLEEILNYFDNRTTNAFTEGVHTKVKLLKRISFGLRNPQVYVEKLELGFVQPKMLISTHTY